MLVTNTTSDLTPALHNSNAEKTNTYEPALTFHNLNVKLRSLHVSVANIVIRALEGEPGPTGGKLGCSSSLPVYLLPTTRNRRRGGLEGGRVALFEIT